MISNWNMLDFENTAIFNNNGEIITQEYIQKNIGADGVIYSEIVKTNPHIVVDYFRRDKNSQHLEKSTKKRW